MKASAADPALTLLDVARGKYLDCALSLAATAGEVATRVEKVSTAHMLKKVEPGAEQRTLITR